MTRQEIIVIAAIVSLLACIGTGLWNDPGPAIPHGLTAVADRHAIQRGVE